MEGIAPSERIAASFQYPRLDVATQQFSTFQAFSGLFRSLHSGLVAQAAYFPGDVTCRAAGKNHHENEADTMNFVNGRQHASSHLEDRGADSIKRIDRRNRLCGRRWIASMCLPGLLMALTSVPVEAQVLRLWGDDTSGQISGAPDGEFKAIAGGALHSLALRFDGTPVLWGVGPFGPPPIPAALATERFNSIAIGRNDAVLIQLDGSLAAFGRTSAIVDVQSGFYKAVSVSAAYAVAIGDDGRLKAWGLDSHSTVSGPTTGLLNAPKGGVFKEVDSIVLYSLALHEDGTIYGWGSEGSNGTNVLDGWTPTPEDPRIFYLPGESYKAISAGQDNLKDLIYKYITGPEFNMRVKRIADTYIQMQKDMESEKRAMNRYWGRREKQFAIVLENVTGMYGEIEGLVGGQKALPDIDVLSLEGDVEEEI